MKYHISKNGEPAECTATHLECPRGGAESHYETKEDAQKAFELSMANKTDAPVMKKTKKGNTYIRVSDETNQGPKVPTMEKPISSVVEKYEHPQGKIAIIKNGQLYITKNGKQANSSATIQKLREGRGAWKKTDDTTDVDVSNLKSSDSEFSEMTKTQSDEKIRLNSLQKAGYPTTSVLDPQKKPKMQDREPVSEVVEYRYNKYTRQSHRDSRALLPTQTRLNPHENPMTNEFMKGWSDFGDESVVAIVKQANENGKPTYRSLVSGHDGESDDIIGDKFPMQHDQTGAAIGDGPWEVVGVYEAKEKGGAAIGEIPDRKIPLYVYK